MINMVKLPTKKSDLFLRVAKGHFATSHSHINYYIDVTTQKSRLSEAKAVARELVSAYQHSTIVDTVLCLDGTQVIGTCLANELTKDGFANMNAPPDHLCHHPGVHHRQPDHPARQSGPHGQGQACAHPGRFHHHRLHRAGRCGGRELLRRHGGRAFGYFCHHPRVPGLPRSPPSSTPPACRTTPALTAATAPCARPASISTPWSTALAIRPCKETPNTKASAEASADAFCLPGHRVIVFWGTQRDCSGIPPPDTGP